MKTKFSSINLLTELKKIENAEFLAEFIDIHFPKNNLIYSPGYDKDFVFIVKKGRLRLYLAVEDKDFSLAILEPGDIYVTHTRAHVETLDDVILMVMPTSKLHSYMTTHPALSKTIISILGKLLKQSFSIIDSLVFKDIKQRLTDFFIYEATHNGMSGDEGVTVRLDLTSTQLAAIVGASRQTVSTIVSTMLKDGVLEKKDRNVYLIPNIDLFRNYAHT
ncbi:MAG TPA: Crp/Fnr family transcriptional regulator [Desulfocapsa sulfexigens]|nr:Crp/Fnr family transcriptional regulator [Desulfocapsa sulfexigens]